MDVKNFLFKTSIKTLFSNFFVLNAKTYRSINKFSKNVFPRDPKSLLCKGAPFLLTYMCNVHLKFLKEEITQIPRISSFLKLKKVLTVLWAIGGLPR